MYYTFQVHFREDFGDCSGDNDLALLELRDDISDQVATPICMPTRATKLSRILQVAGAGMTADYNESVPPGESWNPCDSYNKNITDFSTDVRVFLNWICDKSGICPEENDNKVELYEKEHSIDFCGEAQEPTPEEPAARTSVDISIEMSERCVTVKIIGVSVFERIVNLANQCREKEERVFAALLCCHLKPTQSCDCYIFHKFQLEKKVSAFFKERLPSAVIESYPTTLFYMTQKEAHSLEYLDAPSLPAGYSIGSADPEADTELITKTWIHSKENEVEQTRSMNVSQSGSLYSRDTSLSFVMVCMWSIVLNRVDERKAQRQLVLSRHFDELRNGVYVVDVLNPQLVLSRHFDELRNGDVNEKHESRDGERYLYRAALGIAIDTPRYRSFSSSMMRTSTDRKMALKRWRGYFEKISTVDFPIRVAMSVPPRGATGNCPLCELSQTPTFDCRRQALVTGRPTKPMSYHMVHDIASLS
ncbi:unnamed protein product [Heligmosomoides polygyrus]|uniref:Anoctamin n=1 Tax=Heligmosomoides polygyrus TaxID=6339 RepID=A0A3P7WHH7_HELPZ|nr:unnamed protein product [Heligmosomoides polygyrus]